MEKKQPIIELKHIKKCYTKDVPVIYDFNLTINEDQDLTFTHSLHLMLTL